MSGVGVVSTNKKDYEEEIWGGNSESLFHFSMGFSYGVRRGLIVLFCHSFLMYLRVRVTLFLF